MMCKRLAYSASVLDCFPPLKSDEDSILVQNVPKFFLPMGASIEAWPESCVGSEKNSSSRTFSTCVFTDEAYNKYYGASVTFFEPYTNTLTDEQLEKFDLGDGFRKFPKSIESSTTSIPNSVDKKVDEEGAATNQENYLFYCNKAICIVSRYPFFEPFRRFLFFLLNSVTVGKSKVPIERYISHLVEVADIFHAPLSFMAGVDSRYFDLKEDPPSDVTCFDLDTATVSKSSVRKFYKLDMLPKKPLKRLRNVLDEIFIKTTIENASSRTEKDNEKLYLQKIQSETAIREAFLKFVCSLMDGYLDYLRPLLSSPKSEEELDINRLFDWNLFLHSRDKHSSLFYQKFRETTCFIRFIEERSGALSERGEVGSGSVDRSIYYIFFDDCISKINTELQNAVSSKDRAAAKERVNNMRLLDADSIRANRTVVIQAPQMLNPEFKDTTFTFTSFPHRFCDKLFERDFIRNAAASRPPQHYLHSSTKLGNKNIVLRTRQEIRKSMSDTSILYHQNIMYWPRSVLFFAYSIWFMQLPSMLALARSKKKMLILGLRVIARMEQLMLPIHDQICYRVLMQLCGDYDHPELAVYILRKMLRIGIVPNAVTYKVYHQALIKGNWPSEKRICAINSWRKLRLCLEVCIRFKQFLPQFDTSSEFVEQEASPKNTSDELVNNAEDQESIVKETGIIIDEIEVNEDKNPSIIQNHQENNSNNVDGYFDPLGAEVLNKKRTETNTVSNQIKNTPLMEKAQSRLKKSPNGKNAIIKVKNTSFISPSREKFMKEHSASPFALEDEGQSFADKMSLNSEKKKRRSLRLGGSWFKNFASNSPIFNTLMNRSHTTENLEKMSKDGGSTYNEVLGPATELLERSGINPARILNEAKLNLSKSYQNPDQSLLSTISSSNNNLMETGGDFFFRCTKNAKDLISISYWMQEVIPDDNTELKNVWLRKKEDDDSFLPEDFLDVFICSSSICSNCEQAVYDDELTLGWCVDDANLNIQAFTVPYVNPLVLRRELETLLIEDGLSILGRPSMRISHPIIFWNMFYYCRRLELPTHLLTWRPVLTDQLLNRPPFKFLHDIVSEVIKSTGYSDGLFTVDELDSTKASSSRDSKIAFLQKLIDLLNINGELDDLKPAKIVAGKEPELTNILLQSLAIEAAAYKQQQKEKKTTTKSKSSKSSSKEKAEKSKERDSSKSRSKTTSKLKTKDEKEEKVKVPEESSKVKKSKNEEQVILETKSRSKEKKSSTSKEKTSKDSTLKENKERKKKRSDSISKSGTKVSTTEVTASASPILSTQQQISQPHTELFYNSSLPNTGRTPPGRESSGGTSKGGDDSGIAEETGAESERHDLSERSILAKNSRPEFIEVTDSTPDLPPPQPFRPGTAIGRPQTAIGRPGTAVARPAPPKPKKNIIATNLNEEESSIQAENKMLNLILDEKKEETKNEDSWWNGELVEEEDEQHFMLNSTGANINKLAESSEEHGVLVNKIIENTRELEKDQIKVDDTFMEGDSLDMHEQIRIRAEIETTQKSLQKMTQYVQPLVRTLEFVVDDFDSMLRELEETRKQISILERKLAEQTVNADSETTKLNIAISTIDNDIEQVKEQIAGSTAIILRNENKLSELLSVPHK
uniref:UDENN domain-containing protein n=1 Tax=Meloidogyne javanica TaxID=6303 RepID=A0A915N2R7_MELJA